MVVVHDVLQHASNCAGVWSQSITIAVAGAHLARYSNTLGTTEQLTNKTCCVPHHAKLINKKVSLALIPRQMLDCDTRITLHYGNCDLQGLTAMSGTVDCGDVVPVLLPTAAPQNWELLLRDLFHSRQSVHNRP